MTSRPRPLASALLCLLLGLLAALPRLCDVGTPFTPDETVWFKRTSDFATAVLDANAPATYQTGHPGVATMWIAGLAMGLDDARDMGGDRLSLTEPRGQADYHAARAAMALTATVLLTLLVFLVARAFGPGVAALAGLLLALDPWLAAYGRIVHLDGLLAALVAIVALACLLRWWHAGGIGYVALAGVAAGLAVLTKSTALVLLPPMALLLAAGGAARRGPRAWRLAALDLAALGILGGAVVLLVWPAARADPLGVLARVVSFSEQKALEPHEHGSFFLGQPVADPGPAFYPVVLAFRLSPLVLLGLAALAATRAARRDPQSAPRAGVDAALLLGCAAIALLVVTLGAKKLDRYVLPAVPLVTIAAAVGLRRGLVALPAPPGAANVALGVVGLAQLALCAGARPYYFSYYSPLLGGAPLAQRVLPIGWGEGVDLVAAYLNVHPAKPARSVLAPDAVRITLRVQTKARIVDPSEQRKSTDYLLTYVSATQRDEDVPLVPGASPLLTVRIDGVDYARLWTTPGREKS